MLYNFVYKDHLLWELQAIILRSHTLGEILYTLVVFPLTALIFLTQYPDTIKGKILRNIKFIAIYIIIEVILDRYGEIVYGYGWNIWWSLAWDCMMFPIWVLHYKKPLIAYGVSLVVVVIVLLLFPVCSSQATQTPAISCDLAGGDSLTTLPQTSFLKLAFFVFYILF